MSEDLAARLVLDALRPVLRAAESAVLLAHPMLADEPLFILPGAGRQPEEIADEILRALGQLRDGVRRYRRLTRPPR